MTTVVHDGVEYVCEPSCQSGLTRALKYIFLTLALASPLLLAAKWALTRGQLNAIRARIKFLETEKDCLKEQLICLENDNPPLDAVLNRSVANRIATLHELRYWARQRKCTGKKLSELRQKKDELECALQEVRRERDVLRRDYQVVESIYKKNCALVPSTGSAC